jgi:hypothetical protein
MQQLAILVVAFAQAAVAQITVHADGFTPPTQQQIRGVVSATTAEAARLWSIDPDSVRGDVTVHPDAQHYERAEDELTKGRFRNNGAFALGDQAHVLVQPPITPDRMESIGVPAQTLRLIAHEAAHVLRNTLPNHPSHPGWLADGAGQLIAERTMLSTGRSAGRAEDPWTSTQIVRLRAALDDGRLPTIEALLGDEQGALSASERYAARWALAAWMDEVGALTPTLAAAKRLGGGRTFAERLRERTLGAIREQGVDAPDAAWHAWIRRQPAAWEERIRSLSIASGEPATWTQIAFPDSNAVAWTTASQPSDRYTLGGAVEIVPGERRQMNLLLARSDSGFISIALTAGWGVTVFHYASDGNRWNRIGAAEFEGLRAGVPLPFTVRAADGRIAVEIDDQLVLEVASPVPLHGPWGVGAQSGSAGVWRGVRLAAEEE